MENKPLLKRKDTDDLEINTRSCATVDDEKITPTMIRVLIGICYVNLASNACFSVLASFFDAVSEEKGVTKSEVGLILASSRESTCSCPHC